MVASLLVNIICAIYCYLMFTRGANPVYRVATISSGTHISTAITGSHPKSLQVHHGRIELDSHTDTIVLGKNATVMSFTGKTCQVSPYNDTYKAITNMPVATGATLWTDPGDGQEYILVFHEALYMGDTLEHSLINPNQLQSFGIIVQDNPFANAPLGIEDPFSGTIIPLSTLGTVIYADTRSCTDDDLLPSSYRALV